MLKKKIFLKVIRSSGCERLLLINTEMDVYVHTALTGVRVDSEIFDGEILFVRCTFFKKIMLTGVYKYCLIVLTLLRMNSEQ